MFQDGSPGNGLMGALGIASVSKKGTTGDLGIPKSIVKWSPRNSKETDRGQGPPVIPKREETDGVLHRNCQCTRAPITAFWNPYRAPITAFWNPYRAPYQFLLESLLGLLAIPVGIPRDDQEGQLLEAAWEVRHLRSGL